MEYEYAEVISARRGWMHLMDEELIGDDIPGDGDNTLALGTPPLTLQQAAFDAWQNNDFYARERPLLGQQMRKKNPLVTDSEIEAELERSNRATFQCDWLAIERAIKFNEELLRQLTDGLLKKYFYLLEKYALPFLESKLS